MIADAKYDLVTQGRNLRRDGNITGEEGQVRPQAGRRTRRRTMPKC